MSHKYYVFTNPPNAVCQLIHDTGWSGVSIPAMHPSGRQGQVFDIPDTVPNANGANLVISAEGKMSLSLRGLLTYMDEFAYMQCDDFSLLDIPQTIPPEVPLEPTAPGNSPQEIIKWVYNSVSYDLSTHDGCGQFTEACCEELHKQNSEMWGHIRKNPGQNQYNTHAVDALQCLGGTYYGIWDIIHDSVSPNAKPAFNHKGDADPSLYCYPASACSGHTVVVVKGK